VFSINSSSGELFVSGAIDREQSSLLSANGVIQLIVKVYCVTLLNSPTLLGDIDAEHLLLGDIGGATPKVLGGPNLWPTVHVLQIICDLHSTTSGFAKNRNHCLMCVKFNEE